MTLDVNVKLRHRRHFVIEITQFPDYLNVTQKIISNPIKSLGTIQQR